MAKFEVGGTCYFEEVTCCARLTSLAYFPLTPALPIVFPSYLPALCFIVCCPIVTALGIGLVLVTAAADRCCEVAM